MSAVLNEAPETEVLSDKIEVAVMVTPEIQQAIRGTGALAVAQAYDIDSADMAQALADERRMWAKRIDRLEAMKKDLIAPAKEALDKMRERLSKWFDAPLQDLVQARELAGQKLLAWEKSEQERVAREKAVAEAEARRVRQEADAKAAAERARAEEAARVEHHKAVAAEAERQRQVEEAERQRREGNAKAAAEAERKAKAAAAEAAKAQEKEQAAIENGEAKAQQATMEAAARVSSTVVTEAVKISGQAMKDNWLAELRPGTTIEQATLAICKDIAAGRVDLLPLVEVNTAPRGPLNKLAAALKGAMNVPGFVAVNKQTIAGARK